MQDSRVKTVVFFQHVAVYGNPEKISDYRIPPKKSGQSLRETKIFV